MQETIQNWQIRWLKIMELVKTSFSNLIVTILDLKYKSSSFKFYGNHYWLKYWNQALSNFDSNNYWLQDGNQVISKSSCNHYWLQNRNQAFSKYDSNYLWLYTNDSIVSIDYKYISWGLVKNTSTYRELTLPNQRKDCSVAFILFWTFLVQFIQEL